MIHNNFVMVDGIDGAGKGVGVTALKEWAELQGKKVLDLREYWKNKEGFPDTSDYEVIISAEPTFTGTGKIIRERLVHVDTPGSPQEIAQAYAEDRKALYTECLIPALENGKIVFQERGVITSLVYQPLMEKGLSLEEVKALPGNDFCLSQPPGLIIILTADPEVAATRLEDREKQDKAIFERTEFQKKTKEVYESVWLRELFEKKGTMMRFISTNPPKKEQDTKLEIISIWKNYHH